MLKDFIRERRRIADFIKKKILNKWCEHLSYNVQATNTIWICRIFRYVITMHLVPIMASSIVLKFRKASPTFYWLSAYVMWQHTFCTAVLPRNCVSTTPVSKSQCWLRIYFTCPTIAIIDFFHILSLML